MLLLLKPLLIPMLIAAVAGSGFLYMTHLKNKAEELEAQNQKLVTSVEAQKEVIELQKEESEKIRKAVKKLAAEKTELNKLVDSVRIKIDGAIDQDLSVSDPVRYQKEINKGSSKLFGCVEIAMGKAGSDWTECEGLFK